MGDTQFHFRIRCSPRSCHRNRQGNYYEAGVPLGYRVRIHILIWNFCALNNCVQLGVSMILFFIRVILPTSMAQRTSVK